MSTILLRQVPGTSPVHRLWAGTKLLCVFATSLPLMLISTWPVLGVAVAYLLLVGLFARIPLGALPRLRWWFWALLIVGALINVPTGGAAVLRYTQLVVFGLLLVGTAFLVVWTTPLGEIAPAVARLGAPLRRLRIPIDEWAVAIALCLRSLPLLLEELRVLRAARKLRPHRGDPHRPGDNPLIDLSTAALAVATRRAGELGEAITARGGTGQLTAYPGRPGRWDALALTVTLGVCALDVALYVLLG